MNWCHNYYKDHRTGNNIAKDLEKITPTSTDEWQNIRHSQVEEILCTLKRNKGWRSQLKWYERTEKTYDDKFTDYATNGIIRDGWSNSILTAILNKGNVSDSTTTKEPSPILLIPLLNTLKQQLNFHLSDEELTFTKDRSTLHEVRILQLIAEKREKDIELLWWSSYEVFDTIKHKVIWAAYSNHRTLKKKW